MFLERAAAEQQSTFYTAAAEVPATKVSFEENIWKNRREPGIWYHTYEYELLLLLQQQRICLATVQETANPRTWNHTSIFRRARKVLRVRAPAPSTTKYTWLQYKKRNSKLKSLEPHLQFSGRHGNCCRFATHAGVAPTGPYLPCEKMNQWKNSELEQNYGISYSKKIEVEVLPVVDLIADSPYIYLVDNATQVKEHRYYTRTRIYVYTTYSFNRQYIFVGHFLCKRICSQLKRALSARSLAFSPWECGKLVGCELAGIPSYCSCWRSQEATRTWM